MACERQFTTTWGRLTLPSSGHAYGMPLKSNVRPHKPRTARLEVSCKSAMIVAQTQETDSPSHSELLPVSRPSTFRTAQTSSQMRPNSVRRNPRPKESMCPRSSSPACKSTASTSLPAKAQLAAGSRACTSSTCRRVASGSCARSRKAAYPTEGKSLTGRALDLGLPWLRENECPPPSKRLVGAA
jgi:hypothetical protein